MMNKRLSTWLFPARILIGVLFVVGPALTAGAQVETPEGHSLKLAVVAGTGVAGPADLLTAELSALPSVEMYERIDLDAVLDERALDFSRLNAFLPEGADAVVMVESEGEGRPGILARVLSVRTGVVLATYPAAKAEDLAGSLARGVQGILSSKLKLTRDQVIAVTVGVPAAEYDPLSSENQVEAAGLGALIAREFAKSKEYFVLERDRMESLAVEVQFAKIDEASFWTGSYSVKVVGLKRTGAGNYEADAIWAEPFEQGARGSGTKLAADSLQALAAKVVESFGESISGSRDNTTKAEPFSAEVESSMLASESLALLRIGMLQQAESRIDAALAIGGKMAIRPALVKGSVLIGRIFPRYEAVYLGGMRLEYYRRDGERVNPKNLPDLEGNEADGQLSDDQKQAVMQLVLTRRDFLDIAAAHEGKVVPSGKPDFAQMMTRRAAIVEEIIVSIEKSIAKSLRPNSKVPPLMSLAEHGRLKAEIAPLVERNRKEERDDSKKPISISVIEEMGSSHEERIGILEYYLYDYRWDSSEWEAEKVERYGVESREYWQWEAERTRRRFQKNLRETVGTSFRNAGKYGIFADKPGFFEFLQPFAEGLQASPDPARRLDAMYFYAEEVYVDEDVSIRRYEEMADELVSVAEQLVDSGLAGMWAVQLSTERAQDEVAEQRAELHAVLAEKDRFYDPQVAEDLATKVEYEVLSKEVGRRVAEDAFRAFEKLPVYPDERRAERERERFFETLANLGSDRKLEKEMAIEKKLLVDLQLPLMTVNSSNLISYRFFPFIEFNGLLSRSFLSHDRLYYLNRMGDGHFLLASALLSTGQWDRIVALPDFENRSGNITLHVDAQGTVHVITEQKVWSLPVDAETWKVHEWELPTYATPGTVIDDRVYFWQRDRSYNAERGKGLFSLSLVDLEAPLASVVAFDRRPAQNLLDTSSRAAIDEPGPAGDGRIQVALREGGRSTGLWELEIETLRATPLMSIIFSAKGVPKGGGSPFMSDGWYGRKYSEGALVWSEDQREMRCLYWPDDPIDGSVSDGLQHNRDQSRADLSRLVEADDLQAIYDIPDLADGTMVRPEGERYFTNYYNGKELMVAVDRYTEGKMARVFYYWPEGKAGADVMTFLVESRTYRDAYPKGKPDEVSDSLENLDSKVTEFLSEIRADEKNFYLVSSAVDGLIVLPRERLAALAK